jgi:hypothetical protein
MPTNKIKGNGWREEIKFLPHDVDKWVCHTKPWLFFLIYAFASQTTNFRYIFEHVAVVVCIKMCISWNNNNTSHGSKNKVLFICVSLRDVRVSESEREMCTKPLCNVQCKLWWQFYATQNSLFDWGEYEDFYRAQFFVLQLLLCLLCARVDISSYMKIKWCTNNFISRPFCRFSRSKFLLFVSLARNAAKDLNFYFIRFRTFSGAFNLLFCDVLSHSFCPVWFLHVS